MTSRQKDPSIYGLIAIGKKPVVGSAFKRKYLNLTSNDRGICIADSIAKWFIVLKFFSISIDYFRHQYIFGFFFSGGTMENLIVLKLKIESMMQRNQDLI